MGARARERGTVLHGPDDEAAEGDEEDSKQPDVEGEGHKNVAHAASTRKRPAAFALTYETMNHSVRFRSWMCQASTSNKY